MVNRRDFIRLAAASSLGLVIGFPKAGLAAAAVTELHPLIRIGTDGRITLYAQNPEMGQGVKTALPMIIAEELDVDWDGIRVEQADWDPRLENQFSGGSLSIRLNYTAMRRAGATARAMLLAAAAERWNAPEQSLATEAGYVVDPATGARLAYGALAAAAAMLPVPENPPLKDENEFRLLGTSVADVDNRSILTGSQVYSLDLRLPDMLYATVKRCPHGDGQPVSFDATAARTVRGVVAFHMLKNVDHGGRIILPNCPNFVSGVAVLANSTWAALEGARKLEVEWLMPDQRDDIDELMQKFETALTDQALVVRQDGDEIGAATDIDVVYRLPYFAHVPMEPMNCTARADGNTAEVWAPTQNPPMAAEAVAKVLGIPQENVTIHVMRSGGAFGRRYYADFIVDTVLLAKQFRRPVKVTWSREDDIRHDYFRAANVQRVRSSLRDGRISHWHQKVVSHSREIYLGRDGSPAEIYDFEFPAGFVPSLLFEYVSVPARIPLGQWRATEHSGNVFVVSSAIDELASAHGIDPVELWLRLIGDEQYVQVREDFRFDAARLRHVVELAAARSGWGTPLPRGSGRGFAASYNQGAWVAEVAEVTVRDGNLYVDRITCAVDCGRVINPQGARNQVEGAIVEGLSAALHGRITVRDGVVQESNFHDYPFCRIHEIPRIDVHFVERSDAPRGLGEGPLPPVAPAITNAIFAATGKRIRELPLGRTSAIV
ncbi:MAG: molybdopterin-dependent oxidoreductase [Gammaproteobacteria bacterium]|nr:molybdopterin-dependent oxidoreductase [Gammaproteobacteria bacterium]MDH4256537.1 molybdopterin-dependent oxidoreductase [Gammaproteobacteria bacterium]MDH5311004.1 molybdopterin-dependent oxidoreductase [Gammaproteobacteria bacterium]